MIARALAILVLLGLAVTGCGLKGPLYLPEKSGEVVIRPGPAAAPPTTSVDPPAPGEPAETVTPQTTTTPPEPPPPEAQLPESQLPTGTERG